MKDRYRVQGELIRGEPRVYWVYDSTVGEIGRKSGKPVSIPGTKDCYTTDKRQANRWAEKMNEQDD
jgi:hypothetical protein